MEGETENVPPQEPIDPPSDDEVSSVEESVIDSSQQESLVKGRRRIDDKQLKAAYGTLKRIKTKGFFIARREQKEKPGLLTEAESRVLLIPSAWLKDADSLLFALIVECQIIIDSEIFAVDDEDEGWTLDENDPYIRKILTGIILGLSDAKLKRLDRSKDTLECVRTLIFAMRLKHEFANNPRLGLGALKKNNFYFGNNPKEVIKAKTDNSSKKRKQKSLPDIPVSYEWNSILGSLFGNDFARNFFDKVIHKATFLLKLDNFSETEYIRTISSTLRSYDELVRKFSRPLFEVNPRTKKKIVKKYRLPEKPSRPSLLLKEEYQLITQLISPIWSSSTVLKRNWCNEVLENGFPLTEKYLLSIYTERWRIIEAIARLTKGRLERIRKMDARYVAFKKADITPELLSAYLTSRANQIGEFYLEIRSVLGKDLPLCVVKTLCSEGTHSVTNLQTEMILKNCIIESYRTCEIQALKDKYKDQALAEYTFTKISDEDVIRTSNAYDRAVNLSVRIDRLSRINWLRHSPINVYSRVKELMALTESLVKVNQLILNINKEELEAFEYIRRSVPNTTIKFDKGHSVLRILEFAKATLDSIFTKVRTLKYGQDLLDYVVENLEPKEVSARLSRKAQLEAISGLSNSTI